MVGDGGVGKEPEKFSLPVRIVRVGQRSLGTSLAIYASPSCDKRDKSIEAGDVCMTGKQNSWRACNLCDSVELIYSIDILQNKLYTSRRCHHGASTLRHL